MSHFEFKSHRKVASPLVFNTGPFVLHLTAGPFTSNFYVACNVQRRTRYIYCLCEILVTCLDVLDVLDVPYLLARATRPPWLTPRAQPPGTPRLTPGLTQVPPG